MPQLNDSVVDKVGPVGGGDFNDVLLAYFLANGATSLDIDDAAREFLIAALVTPGPLPDMWYEYFTGLGYSGTLNDMWLAWATSA